MEPGHYKICLVCDLSKECNITTRNKKKAYNGLLLKVNGKKNTFIVKKKLLLLVSVKTVTFHFFFFFVLFP